MQKQEFGCRHCWPANAHLAWAARASLRSLKELIDESHFIVKILACSCCDQQYLSVFTETIDWAKGEDPQDSTLLPLTAAEAAGLLQQGTAPDEMSLNTLGRERRSLRREHPQTGARRVFWACGILVGPHD